MGIERRKFIRHPLSYPIATKVISTPGERGEGRTGGSPESDERGLPAGPTGGEMVSRSENIGAGGILFQCGQQLAEGTGLRIHLQVERRCFTLDGRVVRARKTAGDKYAIAVAFDTPSEILKVRMMEQIVRIELFKCRLERRFKKTLDFGAVAKEWIRRYSKMFAERYGP